MSLKNETWKESLLFVIQGLKLEIDPLKNALSSVFNFTGSRILLLH